MSELTVSQADEKSVKGLGFLRNRGTDNFSARTLTVNGRITADAMICLCEAAKLYGNGNLTLTSRLSVECPGIPFENIPAFRDYIAKAGLTTGGTGAKVRPIVACKGTLCRFGLIDTFAIAEQMHERFYKGLHGLTLPHKFKIAVSGCPNKCVKPDLNDVGIIGQLVPQVERAQCRNCAKCIVEDSCPMRAPYRRDGALSIDRAKCANCGGCVSRCPFSAVTPATRGYKIFIGGRWGKQCAAGTPLRRIFTDSGEVLDVVERAINFFANYGRPGERFGATIARYGFDFVEAALTDQHSTVDIK